MTLEREEAAAFVFVASMALSSSLLNNPVEIGLYENRI